MKHPRVCLAPAGRRFLAICLLAAGRSTLAQAVVSPVFATRTFSSANIDSTAVWAAPNPGDSLLFVTEKDGDRVQVWLAATGAPHPSKPFLGGQHNGTAPGQFNRPNGVWVVYHVPYRDGFADVLLVTDQENLRVQIFRMPGLERFGEFGTGEVGKGYGIAWYQDGTDTFAFISDNSPPAGFPGKIKKYRFRPSGGELSADLVSAFGSASGTPPLSDVESMLADPAHDRLHVCGDEGGDENFVFRLDGSYAGIAYGRPQFEYDQEGINLYDLGAGQGYLIVSDQYTDDPNQFEVFDRATLAPLGNFQSPDGAALSTSNTDGAYLEQRPLPGFPNGAFYPVHDDRNVHAYDWTDIAEAMGLEIAALDRPFLARGSASARAGGPARKTLWFHDGSWWGALPCGGRLSIARLEDGTFAPQAAIDATEAAAVAAAGDALLVLTGEEFPRILLYSYRPALRAYLERSAAVTFPKLEGSFPDLALEADGTGNPSRGWVAWEAGGEAVVAWSDAGLSVWSEERIGNASAVTAGPRLARLEGATASLWSESDGVAFRLHRDQDPPGTWSPREQVASAPAERIAVAALPAGGIAAVLAAGGRASLWMRSAGGGWTESPLDGQAFDPALVIDGRGGRIHLFHSVEVGGRFTIHHREAGLDGGVPPASVQAIAWPGVGFDAVSYPAALPSPAPDLVVAAVGTDGLGYFFREALAPGPDRSPPITLQHSPASESGGVGTGATIGFRIQDSSAGVDRGSVRLLLNGQAAELRLRGSPRNLLASAGLPLGIASPVRVRIEAADLAENAMTPFEYEFEIVATAEPRFRRGDANEDGRLDLADVVSVLYALFRGGPAPTCSKSSDANDDGRADIADGIYVLFYLFRNGSPPPLPDLRCGTDPTPDALDCAASPCP